MRVSPAPLGPTAADLRSGGRDLGDYVEACCDAIETVDPDVHAFLDEPGRRARLRATAEHRARAFPRPAGRPPLFGVAVGVKDIIHAAGLPTRAGTSIPPALFAGPEAAVVTALRAAGALVLGKTATTEFAGPAPTTTRNPHDLDHTPGGSSSGSAAAVAAGLCPLSIGTQTGGSVIRPAAFCGVVGFKPSFGRVATDGVIPFSESVDTVGLFAQDLGGIRLAAAAVVDGWEPTDTATRATLGVPTGPYLDAATDEAMAAFDAQVDALEERGFTVRRSPLFEDRETIDGWHRALIRGEAARVHDGWFDRFEAAYHPATVELIREGRSVSERELADARSGQPRVRQAVHDAMDASGVDLWVCPAAPGPAPRGLGSTGDPVMNRAWTFAGLPAVTVPAGTVDGLPVGLQCIARFGADERLLDGVGPVAAGLAAA